MCLFATLCPVLGIWGPWKKAVELEVLQLVGGYDLRTVILPKGCHACRPQRKHLSLIRGSLCETEKRE